MYLKVQYGQRKLAPSILYLKIILYRYLAWLVLWFKLYFRAAAEVYNLNTISTWGYRLAWVRCFSIQTCYRTTSVKIIKFIKFISQLEAAKIFYEYADFGYFLKFKLTYMFRIRIHIHIISPLLLPEFGEINQIDRKTKKNAIYIWKLLVHQKDTVHRIICK